MKDSIFIIDDNEKLCLSLSRNFEQLGYLNQYKCSGLEALKELSLNDYDVILLDVSLGSESGVELLKRIKSIHADIPVIMITGYGTVESAVESLKNGAYDYIQKPLTFQKLLVIVENAIKLRQLNIENKNLKDKITDLAPKIITVNRKILEICKKAVKLAKTDLPILIQGESGTGKEGLAELIHFHSERNSGKFVKVNCSAFPENLLDNELFGHEKGAFTGAVSKFAGVFEQANGGTLLLDEIGDMSLATQAKILRTLQNNEIKRIGSEEVTFIDVRFIASTNKDLKSLISLGLFREDLYYRLSAATLYLIPLRERIDDIPLLVDYFVKNINNDSEECTTIDNQFINRLIEHDWPGNIRELKNIVRYSAALCSDKVITKEDLPPSFYGGAIYQEFADPIKDNERTLIIKTLQKTNNNKKKTAEVLKISRKTLYNKIDKYGI